MVNKSNYLAIFVMFFAIICPPAIAETKSVGYTGVEIVSPQGKFDDTLSGEWEIDIKKVDKKTDKNSPAPQNPLFDTTDRIIVDKKGHYKWMHQGQVISKGKFVKVRPKTGDNKPDKKDYWGITARSEYYYVSNDKGKVEMKNAQTHAYVANLKKAKKITK